MKKPGLSKFLSDNLEQDFLNIDLSKFDINDKSYADTVAFEYIVGSHQKITLSEKQWSYLIENTDYKITKNSLLTLMIYLHRLTDTILSNNLIEKLNGLMKTHSLNIVDIALVSVAGDNIVENYYPAITHLCNKLIEKDLPEEQKLLNKILADKNVLTRYFSFLSNENKDKLINKIKSVSNNNTDLLIPIINKYILEKEIEKISGNIINNKANNKFKI